MLLSSPHSTTGGSVTPRKVEALRDPTSSDLDDVVGLLRTAMPTSCVGLSAVHAEGYRGFLAAAIEPPESARTVFLQVIRDDSGLSAAADWRLIGESLFLNGIAVRGERQGRGYGKLLLADGRRLAGELGRTRLELDVSLDNPVAQGLYQRTGFSPIGEATWADVPPAPEPIPVRLLDWPTFAAQRAAYGFADLRLDTGHGPTVVRAVGTVLRIPAGPRSGALRTALAGVLPTSRCYAMSDGDLRTDGFAHFIRMRMPVDAEYPRPDRSIA